MKRMYKMHETSIILLLLIYIAIVGMINPSFVQLNSLSLMMKSSVILVVLAIGQSFVLFTKNIDVSVGSIMGLSAAVCGCCYRMDIMHSCLLQLLFYLALLSGSQTGLALQSFGYQLLS